MGGGGGEIKIGSAIVKHGPISERHVENETTSLRA